MNPRLTTMLTGLVMLVLGALALFYPALVMTHVLGYTVHPSYSANFVYGEVRAAYGGLFVVAGTYTVLAAMDPVANRGRILFVGMLWLGACAGRLLGAFVDGSPGVWGWVSVAFELLMGGALVAASQVSPPAGARIPPQRVVPSAEVPPPYAPSDAPPAATVA